MKQLMKITEQDSKSDITSVAASSAHGQNRKYTFEEINKDLIQIKNGLIALNLDIFADIIRTDSIGENVFNYNSYDRYCYTLLWIVNSLMS